MDHQLGGLSRVDRALPGHLEEARKEIERIARGYGLDFFDTAFLMCTYDEINMLAAYGGFPIRYPHWRFGMEYLEMQKGYEWGLQKIYEMVINTDPSYAYLMDNNATVDQKLVMAHVFGHVDFFKNNQWFSGTDRKMVDTMANHAARVRRYIDRHGASEVEQWIDMCLSLDNLIDPHSVHIRRERPRSPEERAAEATDDGARRLRAAPHMDRYINPPEVLEAQREAHAEERAQLRGFPESPTRDVMLFLIQHARLPAWKSDVLSIIRDEAYYFAPQGQTKVMNEGWASFWHTRMMTHDVLSDADIIDYCDHHAGTVATRPGQFNPYKIGLELFRDIERRWDRGQFGRAWSDCESYERRSRWDTGAMLGRKKVFEVRQIHNDVTFIDEFLTEDFVRQHGLFTWEYDTKKREYVISSHDFSAVKQKLLFMLSNRGQPRVMVVDGNHGNRGELVLQHDHEGLDIQLQWAESTLGNLARIWGRPVHVRTQLDGRDATLTHDGDAFSREVDGARKGA